MRIIALLIFSTLNITTFGGDLITLNTWLKVEQGAFGAKSISMTVTSNGEVISGFYYNGFQNQILTSNKGVRYYVNTNLALYGNTQLAYGINTISIEFTTSTFKSTQDFEVKIDESIDIAEMEVLIGLGNDSSTYLKDVSVSRIIRNPKEINLSFASTPELNQPILVKIENNSEDTLYGSVGGHFIGKITTTQDGFGYTSYSPYRNCIPNDVVKALLPGENIAARVTNEKECTDFLISVVGQYMFEITLNRNAYTGYIDDALIASNQTRFRILNQYYASLQFSIK